MATENLKQMYENAQARLEANRKKHIAAMQSIRETVKQTREIIAVCKAQHDAQQQSRQDDERALTSQREFIAKLEHLKSERARLARRAVMTHRVRCAVIVIGLSCLVVRVIFDLTLGVKRLLRAFKAMFMRRRSQSWIGWRRHRAGIIPSPWA